MEETYKARHIRTMPRLNLDTDCWIPYADVSWEEEGIKRIQLLSGPSDRFKLIDQAEVYAVEMAMAWIDAEVMGKFHPLSDPEKLGSAAEPITARASIRRP